KSWTKIVGILLKELKNTKEDNRLNLDHIHFNYSSQELDNILDLIQKGQSLYTDFKLNESSYFINSSKFEGNNPYFIENNIKECFILYNSELEKIKALNYECKKAYFEYRKSELIDQIQKILKILNYNKYNSEFLNEMETQCFSYKLKAIFSKNRIKILKDQSNIRLQFKKLDCLLTNSKNAGCEIFSNSIKNNLDIVKEVQDSINNCDNLLFYEKFEKDYSEINLLTFNLFHTESLLSLKEKTQQLETKINTDNWIVTKLSSENPTNFISEVENILEKEQKYFKNDLFVIEFKWYQFYNELNDFNKNIISELKNEPNWSKSFLIYYLNSLLVKFSNIDLPTSDNELIELNGVLNGIENEQMQYIRSFWYSKQIDITREFRLNNNTLSVENLYNKRKSNRFKKLSLRQIVQYDTNLFTTFFPIILTSPDVCCNLFQGKNGYFDIVMFDEASQLRIEDNLPAILKGKQIIIAGDEHQMPPSNYFTKVYDGSIEDEDELEEEDEFSINKEDLLLSCESLLDFGMELNFKKNYLDFHYRSRHPFLIDFSNYAFYNQRLKPLLNDFEYIPIKYIQVNGTFSDHTNAAEAYPYCKVHLSKQKKSR
ncbi:MAG: hypothetical protein Q8862_12115, partial [Bacteroidota bacterium]|nr:hypothetical protein [Bacteroidota bacterium]